MTCSYYWLIGPTVSEKFNTEGQSLEYAKLYRLDPRTTLLGFGPTKAIAHAAAHPLIEIR